LPRARKKGKKERRIWPMQAMQRWIAFAAIITSTLPTFANSHRSTPQDFFKAPDNAVIADTRGEDGGVFFSNTLQNPGWNLSGMPARRWNGSLLAGTLKDADIDTDTDKAQDRIASVPEPGSGLLFLTGLGVVLSCGCGRHYGFFQRIRFPGSAVP
jgi:hypothetical protein